MFGINKRSRPADASAPTAITGHIVAIPDVFYGGADPVIYPVQAQSRDAKQIPTPSPAPAAPKAKSSAPTRDLPVSFFRAHQKRIIIGASAFLAVFIGAVSWYYVRDAAPPEPPAPAASLPPPAVPEPAPTAPVPVLEPVVTTTPAIEDSTPSTSLSDVLGRFPSIILVDDADADADALTDSEEETFGTDSGVWDSDEDDYYDGQEVINLYNPAGFAPVRLVDSGLVRDYSDPVLDYRIYYPTGWEQAAVDPEGTQVIFSAVTGDFVEVRMFEKTPNETFEAWFSRTAIGERFGDLAEFTNRFSVPGYRRKDSLTAYFPNGTRVYVMLYHPREEGPIAFRHIMTMMMQSFRPGL